MIVSNRVYKIIIKIAAFKINFLTEQGYSSGPMRCCRHLSVWSGLMVWSYGLVLRTVLMVWSYVLVLWSGGAFLQDDDCCDAQGLNPEVDPTEKHKVIITHLG